MDKTTELIQNEIKKRIFVLGDRQILYNLIHECIMGSEQSVSNHKAKAKQLISAHESGVVHKLLKTVDRDIFLRDRLKDDIKNNTGYEKDTAEWVVNTWLECIDQETIDLWTEYNNKIGEKEHKYNIDIGSFQEINRDDLVKSIKGIFVPCGIGYDDRGFHVCGIKEMPKCKDPRESIYAAIFNYLQRSTYIDEKTDKPLFIKEYERNLDYDIDYRRIYRLMVIMLLMIKNNYMYDNILSFYYDGDLQELEIAFLTINKYIWITNKLIGNKEPIKIKYREDPRIPVSLNSNKQEGIYVVPNKDKKVGGRIIWFAPRINYKITEKNKQDLEYFLREISNYKHFRRGQFEALQQMLNANTHKICIMPTGSGKSLIFYMNALLQPGVTFVIVPTELLIKDQIENLKKCHNIDDVEALTYDKYNDFTDLKLKNKIYYLVPETFQNRNLLKEFIRFNSDKKILNIVLDEVHCISNWSHDFRPEYLMLSTYLNRYLDRTYFLCFTATANYTVIKDIKEQLKIESDENIISPVELERNNISFRFVPCDDFNQMAEYSFDFLKKGLIKRQKTLVFTKNEGISDRLLESLDDIKYEVEVYRESDKLAYKAFTDGRCKILMASEEVGIGINLSEVHNILHFGLPISKGEYVQEIGRAGRNGEPSLSLVVYMKCNSSNVDGRLLQRTSEISKIIEIINEVENSNIYNDYIDLYRRLIGTIDSQEEFKNLLYSVYNRIKNIDGNEEMDFDYRNIINTKKALYILFAIGYVNNWSLCDIDYENNVATILINKKNLGLEDIKENTKNGLYSLNSDKKYIVETGRATTIEEIIDIYNDWYYNHFIYHHKEQFLDMLSFFESYGSDSSRAELNSEIVKRLASYFSLSMLNIGQDEARYINLSFVNIVNAIISGVEYSTVSNIQRINQDNYNTKLDYFLFVYNLVVDHEYDGSRIERVLGNLGYEMYLDFIESISLFYEGVTNNNKFQIFRDIYSYVKKTGSNFVVFFDMIFRNNKKDLIYYAMLAREVNLRFRGVYDVQ